MAQCPGPSVDEMVNDPIVRAPLMASDGVDRGDLQRLLRSIPLTLRERRVEDRQKMKSRLTDAKRIHRAKADPNQTLHFIKNWVMTGGLLEIAAFGAGAFSVDNGQQ